MASEIRERRKATNARKLGWEDPDRSSPAHDAIVHWLEGHRERIIAQWFGDPLARAAYWLDHRLIAAADPYRALRDEAIADLERQIVAEGELHEQHLNGAYAVAHAAWEREQPYHGQYCQTVEQRITDIRQQEERRHRVRDQELRQALGLIRAWDALEAIPREAVGEILDSEWERPIMHASGNSVIGFIDYYLRYREQPALVIQNREHLRKCRVSPDTRTSFWSAPALIKLLSQTDGVSRCYDGPPFWDKSSRSADLCIEVKAELPQVSEVIRQVQFYKVYQRSPWAVCTPDWTHGQTLLEQRIGFIPYTPNDPPKIYKPGSSIEHAT